MTENKDTCMDGFVSLPIAEYGRLKALDSKEVAEPIIKKNEKFGYHRMKGGYVVWQYVRFNHKERQLDEAIAALRNINKYADGYAKNRADSALSEIQRLEKEHGG